MMRRRERMSSGERSMWYARFPWRWIISHFARRHGFVDPASLLAMLDRFAHPSEVAVPVELLRAGVVFHARGLINTKAIQQNLDWIWPYWATQQFDPSSRSFLPRAFSITHVNLTHRNWTAVGIPNCESMPIVDPKGLITPLYDGWSIEPWVVTESGKEYIPVRRKVRQRLLMPDDDLALEQELEDADVTLRWRAHVVDGKQPTCRVEFVAEAPEAASLAICLRPYNPEGVSFVHSVSLDDTRKIWRINKRDAALVDAAPDRMAGSTYRDSDVHRCLITRPENNDVTCDVGMATAALLYTLTPGEARKVNITLPLDAEAENRSSLLPPQPSEPWHVALEKSATVRLPDAHLQFLYDAAVRSVILHSPGEVYPGPYTYKRFWFRDTAFMLRAMLAAGFTTRVERVLDTFPQRQTWAGYYQSQNGEWDANGEALWILHQYCLHTGNRPKPEWQQSVVKGGRWFHRKRFSRKVDAPHAGLLPAGFSAEHLGNNDYYYWDDYWGVAGLRSAAAMCKEWGDDKHEQQFLEEAQDFQEAIDATLARARERRGVDAIPASPYRRMDAGAIGSIVCSYPLQLISPKDPRLVKTLDFLMLHCRVQGAFFQDMIHSGINAYLTLHMAQALLRAEDPRCFELIDAVARLASPTGQWPEAIHPHTLGGCMGDGQHAWASAEWVMMIRNLFVREEDDALILAAGIRPAWLEQEKEMYYGPSATPWGSVEVWVRPLPEAVEVSWKGAWRGDAPRILVRLPGLPPQEADADAGSLHIPRAREGGEARDLEAQARASWYASGL